MSATRQKISALQQAAQSSPEYADIVPLFIGLYGYLDGRENSTGIAFESALTQPEGSTPLLSFSNAKIDRELNNTFVLGIIDLLSQKGRDNIACLQQIGAALQSGAIDPLPLYGAIWERDRAPINELSERLAVPSPLVEYIFEIPLKTALAQFSAAYETKSFAEWQAGTCPICGSRAGMAELCGEEGRRMLSCSACSFSWPFRRLSCAYCGCDDPEKLSYFSAGAGSTRVDTCRACSRYIKTRDSRKGDSEVPLEVEDLLTLHLDLLAAREGFERGK